METRKVIQFGNSSYVISIPKAWINENKLKKGDLIFVERNSNGELILLSKEKKEEKKEKKIIIDAKRKDDKRIEREIIAAYVNGYTSIHIKAENLRINKIKETINELSGMEIVKKTSNEIAVKDILDFESMSIPSLVRRIDNNIRGMFEDVEEAIGNKKVRNKKYVEIYEADGEANKTYRLVLKVIKYGSNKESLLKKLDISSSNLSDVLLLVMSIEHIGDELKRISRLLKNTRMKNETTKRFLKIYSTIKGNYLDTMKIHYKGNKELLYDLAAKKVGIIKECDAISNYDSSSNKIIDKLKAVEGWIYQIIKCITYFEK